MCIHVNNASTGAVLCRSDGQVWGTLRKNTQKVGLTGTRLQLIQLATKLVVRK